MDLLMELNNVRAFSVGCEIKKKKDLTMEVPVNVCLFCPLYLHFQKNISKASCVQCCNHSIWCYDCCKV